MQGKYVEGLASPYYDGSSGSEYRLWDNTYERFHKGSHVIAEDVIGTIDHDRSRILGRVQADTLELWTGKDGLHYRAAPANTSYYQDLKANIEAGNYAGSSFTFEPTQVEWTFEGDKEIRNIMKANIYEVAAVVDPAYRNTSVGVRSDERRAIEQEREDYRAKLETEKRLQKLDNMK